MNANFFHLVARELNYWLIDDCHINVEQKDKFYNFYSLCPVFDNDNIITYTLTGQQQLLTGQISKGEELLLEHWDCSVGPCLYKLRSVKYM